MEKTWFMALMEYNPNGKALRHQKNMSSLFIAPVEKAWFYKDCLKKYVIKDTIPIKISFKVDKSNVTYSF